MENENKEKETETENAVCEESSSENSEVGALGENIAEAIEYQPKNKYEKALYKVYKDQNLAEILKISSYAIVAITVYAFFVRLIELIENPIGFIEFALITGVPFVIVTVLRLIVNAPRPYELYGFYEVQPKKTKGKAFPSRHVFSIFVIAVAIIPWNALLAVILMILGIALAVIRVLLGIHFVRDVVAGGIIGLTSGGIGLLIQYLI